MQPVAPCKDCPDRKVGCHGVCDRYIQFKNDHEVYKSTIRGEYEINAYERANIQHYKKLKDSKKNWKRGNR